MSAVSDVIRQGITNLEAGNLRANAELSQKLEVMRSQLYPSVNLTPTTAGDTGSSEFQLQRMVLMNSLFTSEVVAAAVLDPAFREEVGARAHQILMEHDLVPKPVEDATPPAGPSGPTGPSGVTE